MTRALTLSGDLLMRKEWFGCLLCNTSDGQYYQFNEDAFEVFRALATPQTVRELRSRLDMQSLEISVADPEVFLDRAAELSLLVRATEPQGAFVFYGDRRKFRRDCLVAPSSATICVTDFCPKTCTHCVTRSSPFVDRTGELSAVQWCGVLQQLRDFGVFGVVVTGGEPLVKQGIFEVLQEADRLKFTISLLTDFDGITAEHVARLKTLRRLNDLQVSLDGGTPETHDAIRGKGAFHRALRRMRLLREHSVRYTISCTVNNRNIHEIDRVVQICREYGAAYLYLNPLAPYGRAKEMMRDALLSDDQLRWLAREYARLVSGGIVNAGNPFWDSLRPDDLGESFHPFRGAATAITIGVYNLAIGSRGDCYLDSKMKSEGLLRLGNVCTDDLESMWVDPRLDRLRARFSPDRFTYADEAVLRER